MPDDARGNPFSTSTSHRLQADSVEEYKLTKPKSQSQRLAKKMDYGADAINFANRLDRPSTSTADIREGHGDKSIKAIVCIPKALKTDRE